MLENLSSGINHGILLPIKDGFNVFIWSYEFYFNFILIFLLTIPITILRCYQVMNKGKTNLYSLAEIFVWLFRILQYSLIISFGNNIPVRNLLSGNTWNSILQGLNTISFNQLIWDLVGYGVIFGVFNLLIYTLVRKKWITSLVKKVFKHEENFDNIHLAIILGFKNLFLIPVSLIYLFSILKII